MKKTIIILTIMFLTAFCFAQEPTNISISLFDGDYISDSCLVLHEDYNTGKYHLRNQKEIQSYYSDIIICGLNPKNKPIKVFDFPMQNIEVTLEENYVFRFEGKKYTFRAEGEERTDGYHDEYWYKVKNYKLFLSSGKNEQLITTVEYFDGTSPQILWIGDLDGDNKPDFFVRTATWYENERIELYISSLASKGELVKLADSDEYYREDEDEEEFYKYLITENGADIFMLREEIPTDINDYQIIKDIEIRQDESDFFEILVYNVFENEQLLLSMDVYTDETDIDRVNSIHIFSENYKTPENIGVGSTIEEFIAAYPNFTIWYSYVSNRYVIEMDEPFGYIQFDLDGNDFIEEGGPQFKSDTTILHPEEFKEGAKIQKIRIWGYPMK